jgi:hypothetical protein
VLASVRTQYQDEGQGLASADLYWALLGSDGLVYDASTCRDALAPEDLFTRGAGTTGEVVSANVCFDAPASAVSGASVLVETLDGTDSVLWRR